MMDASFTPSGDWFVFDQTGATIRRGFKTKRMALVWIWRTMVGDA